MAYKVHPNAKRWLKPPTMEQVDAVVSASGASEPRFEAFYGMSIGTIAKARCGFRSIPVKHWHLFLAEDKETVFHKNIHKPQRLPATSSTRAKNGTRLSGLLKSSE